MSMSAGQFLYMCEQEGLKDTVSTRESKLNAIVKNTVAAIAKGYNPNAVFEDICQSSGIPFSSLTSTEIKFIVSQVEKKNSKYVGGRLI